MDNMTKTMENMIIPFVSKLIGENTPQAKIINEYTEKTGRSDYLELLKVADLMERFENCFKGRMERDKTYIKLYNTPVPRLWLDRYNALALDKIYSDIEVIPEKENEFENIVSKLQECDPEVLAFMLNSASEKLYNQLNDESESMLTDDFYNSTTEKDMERYKKYTLIDKLTGVKLYHGTSYENYLQILNDGYIKAANYDEGEFPNEKVEELYKIESGYLFTHDYIDRPISFSFGGYRKNIIPWAYRELQNHDVQVDIEKTDESNDLLWQIGVVFEINPQNYETYFYNIKGEFLIKGNVSLDDVKVHFFRFDVENKTVKETTLNNLKKEGIC